MTNVMVGEALCKILRAVYKNGDTPELVVLFEVDDVDDFLEKADLIQRFSTHNAELIDSLKENGEKLDLDLYYSTGDLLYCIGHTKDAENGNIITDAIYYMLSFTSNVSPN